MKSLMALCLATYTTTAIAVVDCRAEKDDSVRLACWDAAAQLQVQNQAPAAPAALPPQIATTASTRDPKAWPWGTNVGKEPDRPHLYRLHVREKLNAPYEDGKAATLSLTSSEHQNVLKTNLAVIYELPATLISEQMRLNGWATWLGAQWTKDASTKKPVDGRLLRVASLAQYGDSVPVLLGLAIDFAEDRIGKFASLGFRPEITPVFDWSERGAPYSSAGAYRAYLKLGGQIDRLKVWKTEPELTGNAAGLNAKLSLNYYPGGAVSPLRLFSDTLRARDLHASSGIGKRSSTYYDFGFEWMFTRPDQKAPPIAPTLSLHRTIGDNFLTGTARTVQTVLSFGIKAN